MEETKGTIAIGGETDASQKFIAPTLVKDVKFDDALMDQEIFGPILVVIPVTSVDVALAKVNEMYVSDADPRIAGPHFFFF